jgi:RNA polymerase sigma factor (sigma-70 family)
MDKRADLSYESQLVEKAKQDTSAVGELYELYFPRVYAFVAAKVNDQSDAEDVVSTAFMKIVEFLPSYQDRGLPFGAWVFKIARNCLYDFYAKSSKNQSTDLDEAKEIHDEKNPSPHNEAKENETKSKILKVMDELPERDASIIQLKFFSGLNNREIAGALRLTESHVGIILYRTLRKMKPELAELIG